MNSLELEFLFQVNFSLHVTPEVFREYEVELRADMLIPARGLGERP